MSKAERAIAKKLLRKPKGVFEQVDLKANNAPPWMTRAYKNNRYMVMIDDNTKMTNGIVGIKAMVRRHDEKPIPNHWREMQDIKNEIFGPEVTAIEYYPQKASLLMNTISIGYGCCQKACCRFWQR